MITSVLDFTLDKYKELCQSVLKAGYQIQTVSEYLDGPDSKKSILAMRHDVDRLPGRALRMAKLEKSLNIRTTYYFRKRGFSNPNIIKEIAELGHEIGYHYESLDEAKGDYKLAYNLFEDNLKFLRTISNIETICMHGNPLTRWVNLDLWRKYDFNNLGLKGEAFLSIRDVYYFSDTGRIWDMSRKVKDMLPYTLPEQLRSKDKVKTTDDLIRFIKSTSYPRVYLCVHPERWSQNFIEWIMDQTKDMAINAGKTCWRIITSIKKRAESFICY